MKLKLDIGPTCMYLLGNDVYLIATFNTSMFSYLVDAQVCYALKYVLAHLPEMLNFSQVCWTCWSVLFACPSVYVSVFPVIKPSYLTGSLSRLFAVFAYRPKFLTNFNVLI